MKAIVTADWHLRGDRPRCRIEDDWMGTQRQAMKELVGLIREHDCPMLVIGDIFNRSTPAQEVVNMMLEVLHPVWNRIYFMPGNHDLPYHSWLNEIRSAYGTIKRTYKEIMELDGIGSAPFGEPLNNPDAEILCIHELVFPDEKSRPIKEIGKTAQELLDEHPKAKWIFTGDYHHEFVYVAGPPARYLVNPGCITRQAADMKDYKPLVYLVDTDNDDFTAIPLKADLQYEVDDSYLSEEQSRNDRIDSFISTIQSKEKVSLNFIENLEMKAQHKSVDRATRVVITSIIQEI